MSRKKIPPSEVPVKDRSESCLPENSEDLPSVDIYSPCPIWEKHFLPRHEIAARYPLMSWQELRVMAHLITTGTRYTIYLKDGKIVDGSNAYLAHCIASVLPVFEEVKADGPGLERFILRRNSARRMLPPLERARLMILHMEALGWRLPAGEIKKEDSQVLEEAESRSIERQPGKVVKGTTAQPKEVAAQLSGKGRKSKKSEKVQMVAMATGVSESTAFRALKKKAEDEKPVSTGESVPVKPFLPKTKPTLSLPEWETYVGKPDLNMRLQDFLSLVENKGYRMYFKSR